MAAVDWSDNRCVICGDKNAHGMQLAFPAGADGVATTVTVSEKWEGFRGIVHGGVVAGILDDAMWHAAYALGGHSVVTARLEVRYHRPWPVGEAVGVSARVERQKGRLTVARAEARTAAGLVASAWAHFLPADGVGPTGDRRTGG
ncbi:MAG: PaaI family thioesterase [Firmicutes bacterium]|nr:PaaI family thioesterase [Alicyclobacillaceae bacterium]MCL6496787.1 PaaI family thioesterase [Bacillota bacterium]